MTVNLEGFIAFNMLMNMLALLSAARLCGLRISLRRSAGVSAMGVAYGIVAYLPGFEVLQGMPRLLFPFVMGAASFACEGIRASMRASLWICVSTFLIGGLGYGAMHIWGMRGYSLPIVAVALAGGAAACFMLYSGVGRARRYKRSVTVSVTVGGTVVEARGIVDTGNGLVEPFSGLPVVVLDRALLPRDAALPPTRPVPFNSVGGDGEAEAFLPDALLIDGAPVRSAYAAFVGGLDGSCAALVPPEALPQRHAMSL